MNRAAPRCRHHDQQQHSAHTPVTARTAASVGSQQSSRSIGELLSTQHSPAPTASDSCNPQQTLQGLVLGPGLPKPAKQSRMTVNAVVIAVLVFGLKSQALDGRLRECSMQPAHMACTAGPLRLHCQPIMLSLPQVHCCRVLPNGSMKSFAAGASAPVSCRSSAQLRPVQPATACPVHSLQLRTQQLRLHKRLQVRNVPPWGAQRIYISEHLCCLIATALRQPTVQAVNMP